ncbi:hypothetical protein C4561_01335, partial [candidate division WWE3 bacterium]
IYNQKGWVLITKINGMIDGVTYCVSRPKKILYSLKFLLISADIYIIMILERQKKPQKGELKMARPEFVEQFEKAKQAMKLMEDALRDDYDTRRNDLFLAAKSMLRAHPTFDQLMYVIKICYYYGITLHGRRRGYHIFDITLGTNCNNEEVLYYLYDDGVSHGKCLLKNFYRVADFRK